MKKVWKFLTSMKFAIILLVILSLATAGGSFITQNQSFDWYAAKYSERAAAFIFALRLDDVFHSWWYFVLAALLVLDILFCNLLKFPALLRRVRKAPKPRIGYFGPFVAHLGMLILIAGFVLGQVTREEYVIYGYPGQVKGLGETGILVGIDDFQVSFNQDDSVSQYTVDLVATNGSLIVLSKASVNHPAKIMGYKFYQNSFGYTANVRVTKNGSVVQEERIEAGSGFAIADNENIIVLFNAFYPDYVYVEGSGPATKSGRMNNPGYLYSVYYGESLLGMNVLMEGETIRIDDYEVFFEAPGYYTLLQVKKDHFTWLVLAGGIVLLIGLVLSFYVRPLSMKKEKEPEEPAPVPEEGPEEAADPVDQEVPSPEEASEESSGGSGDPKKAPEAGEEVPDAARD